MILSFTKIRKRFLVSLLLPFAFTVSAQPIPKLEILGAYSYFHGEQLSAPSPATGLQGWNASIKVNLIPGIGFLADFSGQYGDRGRHALLLGPEIAVLRKSRFTVNTRALAGVVHTNPVIQIYPQPIERPPDSFGNPRPPITQRTFSSAGMFAAALGGSIDYQISHSLRYRLIQPEALITRHSPFPGDERANAVDFRVATGIVYTVGALTSSRSDAPRFSFGVMGGVALTDAFGHEAFGLFLQPDGSLQREPLRYYSTSKDYIVGPKVEFALAGPVSGEVDFLYRRMHMTWASVRPDGALFSVSPASVVTWEFPVLAKYRFMAGAIGLFLNAGPSFRSAGNLNASSPSAVGGTLGLGVERRLGRVKIAPEVRYIHWAGDGDFILARTKRNQVEFLIGLTF